MKKILAALLVSFALLSCKDEKKQEKDLLNEVIKVHDQVMEKDQLIMTNKMQLDTLMQQNKDPQLNNEAKKLSAQLDSADARMEDWMHKFDAENKGKSHQQIMDYLSAQKSTIEAIDKQFNTTIATSSAFVKQNKSK